MKRRELLQLMCVGLALPTPSQAATQINAARGWRSAEKFRIVLDLSGPITYQAFELAAPQRFVLDLRDTTLSTNLSTLALDRSPVRDIRSGNSGKDTRLVFDLSEPVEMNSFLLGPSAGKGNRLVLDIQPLSHSSIAAPMQAAPQPQVTGQRDIVVVIDAGHGGKDPGAVGAGGEKEKIVALAIAKQLARKINAQRGFKAYLVRKGDVFIALRKRVEIARSHNADMFISVHADAAPRRSASGASVYALSQGGATSTTARWMAKRENKADLIAGKDLLTLKNRDPMLASVILDMSMNATISSSLNIGNSILERLQSVAGLHSKRVEQAGFAVLKSPDIPSVLVETGFISNKRDCRKLVNPRHQTLLADALFKGVHSYFASNPPRGTLLSARS